MSAGRLLAERLSLVVITDPSARIGVRRAVAAALAAGAPAIQLRWKDGSSREMLELARELRRETAAAGALLFINDRVDVALASRADGVHLGDDDIPVEIVRRIAPAPFLIGRSVDTPEEAIAARLAGADYVGAGPIFSTSSKGDTGPVLGVATLGNFREAAGIPLVAIGGIAAATAREVIRAGADGVAVIAAVMLVDQPGEATAEILAEIRKALPAVQEDLPISRPSVRDQVAGSGRDFRQ